jgi:hypothetical protein
VRISMYIKLHNKTKQGGTILSKVMRPILASHADLS